MLIGINIAIEQPAHPDAMVAAKRDIAAQRRLEIDTGSGDRVGNLAVEQTCPVIGFEQAGVAGRRLIEIGAVGRPDRDPRSEEHTSELQSLMRISYAVFCLKKKTHHKCEPYSNMHTVISKHTAK